MDAGHPALLECSVGNGVEKMLLGLVRSGITAVKLEQTRSCQALATESQLEGTSCVSRLTHPLTLYLGQRKSSLLALRMGMVIPAWLA